MNTLGKKTTIDAARAAAAGVAQRGIPFVLSVALRSRRTNGYGTATQAEAHVG